MKIDRDIPPPTPRGEKSPFAKMQVGDSVFFPGENKADAQHPAYMSARNYVKRKGFGFTLRSVEENGVKGIRIWRTA